MNALGQGHTALSGGAEVKSSPPLLVQILPPQPLSAKDPSIFLLKVVPAAPRVGFYLRRAWAPQCTAGLQTAKTGNRHNVPLAPPP